MKIGSGIYKITNKTNGKVYIGSAVNLFTRWRGHKSELRRGKHINKHLQNAWNKDGEQNFLFEIVEEVQERENLIEREQRYIDILNPEYNICKFAGSNLGRRLSEETRQKMSEARKGEKHPNFGKHLSEETRQKISQSRIGEKHPNFGKHCSEETRQKISEANKGKHLSKETRQKMSKARKGNHLSEEHRQKISDAFKGEKSSRAKLTCEKVNEIRENYKTGKFSYAKLAKEYGVSPSAVQHIIENRSWKQ